MSDVWQYQVRVDLSQELAALARRDSGDPALAPLKSILDRHDAALMCQYDAFAGYVAEAEREGVEGYPLYRWTRATIEDPAKKAKYLKSFTLYVHGQEVYGKAEADSLEAELRPLLDQGLITRLAKHDTNPANNPQAPARYRD
jgi:hypothetical protein